MKVHSGALQYPDSAEHELKAEFETPGCAGSIGCSIHAGTADGRSEARTSMRSVPVVEVQAGVIEEATDSDILLAYLDHVLCPKLKRGHNSRKCASLVPALQTVTTLTFNLLSGEEPITLQAAL